MNATGYTVDDFIVEPRVTNSDLLSYAENYVNLPPELVKKYREQVKTLRNQLQKYIDEHPDYNLVKMLHSGSLAKGTALRRINDLDTAVYVKAAAVEDIDNKGLIAWLHDRLREVYPNLDTDQLEPHDHCVRVHYKTSALKDVDVVPVLYEGDPDNMGFLVTNNGDRVLTSISQHIEFVQTRKNRQPEHYAQFVRFAKFWATRQKDLYKERGGHFRFKSLMIELICAHLADKGLDTSDYIKALQQFFAYIVRTGLKDPIFFTDYYYASAIDLSDPEVIKIFDPVNPTNNIGRTYTDTQRELIVQEAAQALNAVISAAAATTKQDSVTQWQQIFGTTFRG